MSVENSRPFQFVRLVMETMDAIGQMDMKSMQAEFGFTKKRIIQVDFVDEDKYYLLQLSDGKIRPVFQLPIFKTTPDIELVIKEMCTIKHLRSGRKRYNTYGRDGRLLQSEVKEYTPSIAYNLNDVYAKNYAEDEGKVTNEWLGRTNESLQAVALLVRVMKAIPAQRLAALIGECDHD